MITVQNLIDGLKELVEAGSVDPKAVVIIARDSEGNDFSPIAEDDGQISMSFGPACHYVPYNAFRGEIMTLDEKDEIPTPKNLIPAICLWPTN